MTRASLLQILNHVTHISQAEVRELEQLAAAFPYCQTAHLLLAKAAHDQGSMLASQRLRHAATYAADRELLRRLIETSPASVLVDSPTVLTPAAETVAPAPAVTDIPPLLAPATSAPEAAPTEALETSDALSAMEATAQGDVDEQPLPVPAPSEEPELNPESALSPEPFVAGGLLETAAQAPEPAGESEAPALEEEIPALPIADGELPVAELAAAVSLPAPLPASEADQPAALAAAEAASTAAEPALLLPADAPTEAEAAPSAEQPEELAIVPIPDDLPAVAPPIRAPADAGFSRFEYGFEEPDSVAPPVLYELPEADDAAAAPKIPPFQAEAPIGYSLVGSSRLGYALVSEVPDALPLPLAAFFEPDALLLAHLEAHKPAPLPTSIDLINRFLKNKPRLKSPAALPPPTDEQADLSVRSTSIVPELASESLAKIMVRQGKVAKAIEIYERLMVRQPEKKAYFADQIQHLKLSQ